MNELFAAAKSAKVDYSVNNVAKVINNASMAGAAGGATSSFFNLSNIAIMLGSIITVITVAVVLSGSEEKQSEPVVEQLQTAQPNFIIKEKNAIEVSERFVAEAIVQEDVPAIIPEELPVFDTDAAPEPEFVEVEDVIDEEPLPEELNMKVNMPGDGYASWTPNAPFHSISLNISADVKIVKASDKQYVKVDKDLDIGDLIQLNVVDGVLYVTVQDGKKREYEKKSRNMDVELIIYMNEVKNLEINGSGDIYSQDNIPSEKLGIHINGSGDVELNNIVPDKLAISVNGSGDVSLYGSGEMQKGVININGSGDVCTKAIDISALSININGSGDVTVSCEEKLDITILGSGDVCYSGSPEVSLSKLGSGEVHNCGEH